MLKDYDFSQTQVDKVKRSELGETFAKLQRELNRTDSSMLVIVDGWESSGKGFVLKDLTRELDPRYHEVSVFEHPTEEEQNRTFLWRFFQKLPKKGNIAFFDRSFYYQILNERQLSEKEMEHHLMDISLLERLLVADGTLVVKLFLHHSKEAMKQRIKALDSDPLRHFLISKNDKKQLKYYDSYRDHFDDVLEKTNFDSSPWHLIPSEDLKDASRISLIYAIEALEKHLKSSKNSISFQAGWVPKMNKPLDPLNKLDLDKGITDETYDDKKDKLQKRAGELLYTLWLERVPCIIVFEGTDAAGKGGSIQRLSRHMDPRGYDVATTAAPTAYERNYHYLWRFFNTFPEKGRLTIYDRSWYGRVLVERVEGLTTDSRWQDAYHEINEMEHNLIHEGHILLKFLIVIDKDEQKKRFEDRQNEPEKSYKLTDEDWRNHEKFNENESAMNDMIVKTNTTEAPWTIIEGTQKKYARIKVLETFISEAETFLKKHKSH